MQCGGVSLQPGACINNPAFSSSDQGKAAAADRKEKRNDWQMGRQMGVAETE